MIILRTLGECVVQVGDTPVAPDADTVFAALVYLAAERGRHLSRLQLAELFWPGASVVRGRHSLRQLLYRLRSLGVVLDTTRERVSLPEGHIAPTFSAAPSRERLREAQARGTLVIGPYLPGYAPTFSAPFRNWLDGYRDVIEGQARRAILDAANDHQLRGEWAEVDALARECLRIDPLNETATILRAQCAAMTGARAEALSILDRYSLDLGPDRADLARPAAALRKRIAEQFPARRYTIPSDSCFVGRADLMSVLTLALLRSRNREGSAVLLWGPPGIGKTRLTQELTSVAVVQNHRIVRVQCEESDARQPMAAWVDGVPQLLRLPGALGVSPEAMPFLRRLTDFDPTAREPSPEARDPQYLAGRIRQAIVDLVDAVASEGTLLLVFEDVHWMDSSSWAALRTLVEWNVGKSVQILMTSRRPHATPAPPQREVARLEVHEVGALDGAASTALVRAIADDHGGQLPAGADAWCTAVGEGNPLFLRELAVHCLEGGVPRAVPPSVQTLLDARIARLRPAARRVLQATAVLGEQATVERLDRVLEMPAHDLIGALDELTEATLIAAAGMLVRPRHDLVAARIGAATSDSARRVLHRRAAVVLEAEVEGGVTLDVMWACAGHWQATGNAGRGLEVALTVANQLIEVGSPADALAVYEGANKLCASTAENRDVERRRAATNGLLGRWFEAARILANLIETERSTAPSDVWGRDMILSIEAHARSYGPSSTLAARCSDLAGDTRLPVELRIDAASLGLKLVTNLGDVETAHAVWAAVRSVQSIDDRQTMQLLHLGMLYELSFGSLPVGFVAADRLRELVRSTTDTRIETIQFLGNLANAARIQGNHAGATELAMDAYRRANQSGAIYFVTRAADKLATIALEVDDVETAVTWYDIAVRNAERCREDLTTLSLGDLSARIMLAREDVHAAHATSISVLALHRQTNPGMNESLRVYLTTATETLLASTSRPVPAVTINELLAVHARFRRHIYHDRTVAVLCRALLRNGGAQSAITVFDEYVLSDRRGPSTLPRNLASVERDLAELTQQTSNNEPL